MRVTHDRAALVGHSHAPARSEIVFIVYLSANFAWEEKDEEEEDDEDEDEEDEQDENEDEEEKEEEGKEKETRRRRSPQ